MAAERHHYFGAGTLVVWDVDVLREEVVRVYRATAPENPAVYDRSQLAEAEPALPGFTMPVEDLVSPVAPGFSRACRPKGRRYKLHHM